MIKIGFVINYINNNGPSRVVLGLLNNLDINIQAVKDETFFVIDDETTAIDTEEELQKLLDKIK